MDLAGLAGTALGRFVPPPCAEPLPVGDMLRLPGRGSTFVIDVPGPTPDAPTVMLLHALGTTAYLSWFPSLAALSQHFRVVALDQRWHGHGIRSDRFRLEDCADDVAALADELGLDEFIVAGYSMGSIVAQLVWQRHADRVSGLVLAAATRNFQGTRRERLALQTLNRAMTPLGHVLHERTERYASRLAPNPHSADAVSKWAMREFRSTSFAAMLAAMSAITMFDSSSWIGEVDCPTSVVVMANDHLIPTRRQRRLAESIPGAHVYECVGSGHAGCVLGAQRFVPTLVDACHAVAHQPSAAA